MFTSYKILEQSWVSHRDLMCEEEQEGGLPTNLLSVCADTRRQEMQANGLSVLTDHQRSTHASRTDDKRAIEAQLSIEKTKVLASYLRAENSGVLDLLFNRVLELELLDDVVRRVQYRDCISFSFCRGIGDLEIDGAKDFVDLMTDSFVRIYIKSIDKGIAYWGLDNDVTRIDRLPGEILSRFYYIRRDGMAVAI